MSIKKSCMKSQTQPVSRFVPLDVQSAKALGWALTGGVVQNLQPMIAPDIPDNHNQTPNQFRLAYFYPAETVARYTNNIDFQASIEFTGPAMPCGDSLA